MPEIPGDLYAEIDRIYDSFDTVLVGRTTALEMAEYWPGAETDEGEPAVARSMARKMNTYKKYVFTRSSEPLEWSNVELVAPGGDEAVVAFVEAAEGTSGRRHPSVRRRAARAHPDPPRRRRPLPPLRLPGRIARRQLVRRDRAASRDSSCRARPPTRTGWSACTTREFPHSGVRYSAHMPTESTYTGLYGREEARAEVSTAELLGQVLFLVAIAIGFCALGTYLGRDLQLGTARLHLLRRLRDAAGVLVRR